MVYNYSLSSKAERTLLHHPSQTYDTMRGPKVILVVCWFVFNNIQRIYLILATFIATDENILRFWQLLQKLCTQGQDILRIVTQGFHTWIGIEAWFPKILRQYRIMIQFLKQSWFLLQTLPLTRYMIFTNYVIISAWFFINKMYIFSYTYTTKQVVNKLLLL